MSNLSLSNKYHACGETKESLVKEIKELEETTSYMVVDPSSIQIFSEKSVGEDNVTFYKITKETMEEHVAAPLYHISKVGMDTVDTCLLAESVQAGTILVVPIDGKDAALYTCSDSIRGLAAKAKITGESLDKASVYRDLYIAESLYAKKDPVTLVVRTQVENGQTKRKLFGVLTNRYKPISLEIVPETIDAFETDGTMGKAELKMWDTTHFYTSALVEFPEVADDILSTYRLGKKLIPGIRVSTSCTGDSSVRIQATLRVDGANAFVVSKEVSQIHMGKEITKEGIIEMAKENLYPEINAIPKGLTSLIGKQIGSEDLTTEAGRKKNKELVNKAIRSGIRQLHIAKAIGRKRAKAITEDMELAIVDSQQYTEFDIAMMFLSLGDRIVGLPESAVKQLEKACARAAFINYQKDETDEMIGIKPEEL